MSEGAALVTGERIIGWYNRIRIERETRLLSSVSDRNIDEV